MQFTAVASCQHHAASGYSRIENGCVALIRKSGITAAAVYQQTGVKGRTQRNWIAAAKKAGTWISWLPT